jgi:hypothetical protein
LSSSLLPEPGRGASDIVDYLLLKIRGRTAIDDTDFLYEISMDSFMLAIPTILPQDKRVSQLVRISRLLLFFGCAVP